MGKDCRGYRKNFCWGRGRKMERVEREREAEVSC